MLCRKLLSGQSDLQGMTYEYRALQVINWVRKCNFWCGKGAGSIFEEMKGFYIRGVTLVSRLNRLCSLCNMSDSEAKYITDMEEFDSFVESLTTEEWRCLDAECEGKVGSVIAWYFL